MSNTTQMARQPGSWRNRKLRLPGFSAERGTTEHTLLVLVMILVYWSYAAFGRDLVFNKLYDPTGYDPVGAVINYIRIFTCAIAVLVVSLYTTFNWALARVPLQFAPFMAMAFLSAIWADDKGATIQTAATLCAIWVALPMIMHRLGAAETVRIVVHIIALVCITSFLLAIFVPSVGRHSGLELVQSIHAGRWRGIFAHKNSLGPWAAYGSVLLFTHSKMAGGPRLYWWFARICAISCLIFAQSSTSIMMAVGMFLTWILLRMSKTQSGGTLMAYLMGSVVVASLFFYFAGDAVFELLGRDLTFTGRTIIWKLALDYLWVKPFIGHGFQSLGGPEFLAIVQQTTQQAIPGAESGYLTLLLNLGILGFVFFFVPFFVALRNGLEWLPYVGRADRLAIEFMVITLVCVFVHAITESGALVAISIDGVISYGALFFLTTLPNSPASILRRDHRKWRARKARMQRGGASGAGQRTLGDVV